MIRGWDYALRLTHEPTGLAAEVRWPRRQCSMRRMRERLRTVLAARVHAHREGLLAEPLPLVRTYTGDEEYPCDASG